MTPFVRRTVEVDGRRVAYIDEGVGGEAPLVLLHGGGFDHAQLSWAATTRALMGQRRVCVPDIAGYGDSASLAGEASLPRLGRWLLDFLDALGIARADLAGVSMGGGMAVWLALEHPGRVRRLAAVCPYGIMARAPFHPLAALLARTGLGPVYALAGASRTLARLGLATAYKAPARISPRTVEELMAVARQQSSRRSFDAFLAAEIVGRGVRTDLSPRIGALAVPSLWVAGSADRLVAPGLVARAARRAPGARLLELPTGHWPMRERPDLFNPALGDFLGP